MKTVIPIAATSDVGPANKEVPVSIITDVVLETDWPLIVIEVRSAI